MKHLIFFAIAMLALSSCQETTVPAEYQRVDVGFEVIQNKLKSIGEYDRGSAPIQVSGLDVTVKNNTHIGHDANKSFDFKAFGEQGGLPMVITDVTVGSNTFTAVSKNEYPAYNNFYQLIESDVEDLDERAKAYADALDLFQPLFIQFYGSSQEDIAIDVPQQVDLSLAAMNGRVNVITECAEGYTALVEVNYATNGYQPMDFFPDLDNIELYAGYTDPNGNRFASAWVLNDILTQPGTLIEVLFTFFDEAGKKVGDDIRNITAINGTQLTKLYVYNGLENQEATITVDYQPILEDNSGEVL